MNFSILAFPANFCLIEKWPLSGNTVWPQSSGFQELSKLTIFYILMNLFSTQNLARFARYDKCDFFYDFQTSRIFNANWRYFSGHFQKNPKKKLQKATQKWFFQTQKLKIANRKNQVQPVQPSRQRQQPQPPPQQQRQLLPQHHVEYQVIMPFLTVVVTPKLVLVSLKIAKKIPIVKLSCLTNYLVMNYYSS